MDHVLIVSVAVGILGLGVLLGLARAAEPPTVSIADVPSYAERTVTVQGHVASVEPTRSGGLRVTLAGDGRSLAAFLRDAVPLLPGDEISITGRVAKYHGQWEIVVEEAQDVEVVTAWDATRTPVAALAKEPWRWLGMQVRTAGVFEEADRASWLSDPAAGARVRVAAQAPSEPGWFQVEGVLTYEEDAGRFVFRAGSWTPTAAPGA